MTLTADLIKLLSGIIGAVAVACVSSLIWIYTTFALADDVDEEFDRHAARSTEIEVRIAKGQYYDRKDDYDESVDEGDQEQADDLEAEIDDLISFICTNEPTWPKCRQ